MWEDDLVDDLKEEKNSSLNPSSPVIKLVIRVSVIGRISMDIFTHGGMHQPRSLHSALSISGLSVRGCRNFA